MRKITRAEFLSQLLYGSLGALVFSLHRKTEAAVAPFSFLKKPNFNASGIERSLRFRAGSSAYLSRTPLTSSSDPRTWTWSGWVKRNIIGAEQILVQAGSSSTTNPYESGFFFTPSDLLQLGWNGNSTSIGDYWNSTMVFRDPNAWYHLVIKADLSNATRGNRISLYVNGVQQTITPLGNSGNSAATAWCNSSYPTRICASSFALNRFLDCELTEVTFVDGLALNASAFGQFESNGIWIPKKYTGAFGTNGYYLNFRDSSSLANLGADQSGNGNHWSASGLSLTNDATYDSMLDYPVNSAAAIRPTGSYATLNPLDKGPNLTLSDGNLVITNSAVAYTAVRGNMAIPSSGKWYFECTESSARNINNVGHFGLEMASRPLAANWNGTACWYWGLNGRALWINDVNPISGAWNATGIGANDVMQLAYDADTQRAWLGINNSWYYVSGGNLVTGGDPAGNTNPTTTIATTEPLFPVYGAYWTQQGTFNFGQRPFAHTPPSGFKALCTANFPTLAIQKPKQHFDIVTRSGSAAATQTQTGLEFSPGFVWVKSRSGVYNHGLFDIARGAAKSLRSDSTLTEQSSDNNGYLSAFTSDGYTLSNGATGGLLVKDSGHTYVDWVWKAGGTPVANNTGSIVSQVSVNSISGFSILTYTGTGANGTVGHGLSAAPKMIIVKKRTGTSGSGFSDGLCWHASLASTEVLYLTSNTARGTLANAWNSTAPTTSVMSLGNNVLVNESTATYVAYCFAEVPGFSRIGTYTGNGVADGPFAYCGFRPRFIMAKRFDAGSTENWFIIDTARDPFNQGGYWLVPNSDGADSSPMYFDIVSNGFKMRGGGGPNNNPGGSYLFIAFAEHPLALNPRAR